MVNLVTLLDPLNKFERKGVETLLFLLSQGNGLIVFQLYYIVHFVYRVTDWVSLRGSTRNNNTNSGKTPGPYHDSGNRSDRVP